MSVPIFRCPVCDQPFDPKTSKTRPFCSDRCRQIDLGRWLDERYGLPYERPFDVDDPDAEAEEFE